MSRSRVLQNKNIIIDEAFCILDAEGLEALSIRRLAKEVGVSSMTLYNYVRNIDDIHREVLIRSFNLLYGDIYAIMQELPPENYSGLTVFAKAYALAFYNFSLKHKNICTYLICAGRTEFHDDAELRPFYNPFDVFFLSIHDDKKSSSIQCACRLYECALMSLIHEHATGVKPITREMLTSYVDTYIQNMFSIAE